MEREERLTAEGLARRTFLKRAAVAAWASPFIVTMMSRSAHAQDPCGTSANGISCTVTAPCGTQGGVPLQCVPAVPGQMNGQCVCAP